LWWASQSACKPKAIRQAESMSRRVEQLPEEQMAIPPSEREAKAFFHSFKQSARV
jgi:hypothetical protein